LTGNRARGSGCPYCSGRVLTPENSLATIYPEIAATWDFEKNAPLCPEDISSKSNRTVWWKCIQCETSWQSDVGHRVIAKVGCPKCFPAFRGEQMRVARLKSFGTLRQNAPEMAMRWHPILNTNLTPDSVGRNSTKPVWWLCPDCGDEWFVSPHYYRKCPHCGLK
jgi:Zn finger protein HypA/HybF involved in hydrogenase expression